VSRHLRKLRRSNLCEIGPNGMMITERIDATSIAGHNVDRIWAVAKRIVVLAIRLAPPPTAHPYREARLQACRIDVDDVIESLAIAHRRVEQDTVDVWVLWSIGLGEARPLLADPEPAAAFRRLDEILNDADRPLVSAYAVAGRYRRPARRCDARCSGRRRAA
jgi:hypothetical protein